MIRWFAHNEIAANFLMVGILLAGLYTAFFRIPLEVRPSRTFDTVYMSMPYRGATAKDVEKAILIPVEEALEGLNGVKMVHIDSADMIDDELAQHSADVVCLCAIGRQSRPDYVETVVRLLKPRWIVPCHWDWFFSPWGQTPPLLPGVNLQGFCREIEAQGVKPILLPMGGHFGLSPSQILE